MSIIYGLIDPTTSYLRYIGVTKKFKRRISAHLYESHRRRNHREKWIMSLKDEGLKPEVVILDEVPDEIRNETEIFFISYFKSLGCDLVNATAGGEGNLNPTQDVRDKISKAHKGKSKPPMSEETLAKMEIVWESRRGKKRPKYIGEKISFSKKGNTFITDEQKQKMSQAKTGKKRKKFTEETIEKMKRAKRESLGKPVLCATTKKYFSCCVEAAEFYGLPRKKVNNNLNGYVKHVQGYQFEYLEEGELPPSPLTKTV